MGVVQNENAVRVPAGLKNRQATIGLALLAVPAIILTVAGIFASVMVGTISVVVFFALPFVGITLLARRKLLLGASLAAGFTAQLLIVGWSLVDSYYGSFAEGVVLLVLALLWFAGAALLLNLAMKKAME